jgi:hypothetical protein
MDADILQIKRGEEEALSMCTAPLLYKKLCVSSTKLPCRYLHHHSHVRRGLKVGRWLAGIAS